MIILRNKLFAAQNNNSQQEEERLAQDQQESINKQVKFANKNTSPPTTPSQAQVDDDKNKVDSNGLQIERMRMQRQLLRNQMMRQKMQMEDNRAKANRITKLQNEENKKDEAENKNQIKVKKIELENRADLARNVSLYKRPTRMPEPVSMK